MPFTVYEEVPKGTSVEPFYDRQIQEALRQAKEYAGKGFVASSPDFARWRIATPGDSPIWKEWLTALTEEDEGPDVDGAIGERGAPIYVVSHRACILDTPERLEKACKDLIDSAAKLTPEEFRALLHGDLPGNRQTKLFRHEEFLEASAGGDLLKTYPHGYSVAVPFSIVKATKSGHLPIVELYDHPLAILRSGSKERNVAHLDKARRVYNTGRFGMHHPFKDIDPAQAQGRLVCLYYGGYCGLSGCIHLDYVGRFAAVKG